MARLYARLAVEHDDRVEHELGGGRLEGEGEKPGGLGEELGAHVGRRVEPAGVQQHREVLARLGRVRKGTEGDLRGNGTEGHGWVWKGIEGCEGV